MEHSITENLKKIGKPRIKRVSWLVLSARAISLVFSPFYLPVTSFILLFTFSYLNLLPPLTKLSNGRWRAKCEQKSRNSDLVSHHTHA